MNLKYLKLVRVLGFEWPYAVWGGVTDHFEKQHILQEQENNQLNNPERNSVSIAYPTHHKLPW